MTYEENIKTVATELARNYFDKVLTSLYKEDYYTEWLELHLPQFEHSAQIAIRLQSEAFSEAYSTGFGNALSPKGTFLLLSEELVDRGLIPALECQHQNIVKQDDNTFHCLDCDDILFHSPSNEQK